MIWDKVARMAEAMASRGQAALRDVMGRSRLFVIDAAPHEFLPKDHTPERCEFYRENFFLPFRHIAIEDSCSLVFLFDRERHQRGLACDRGWMEFLPDTADVSRFRGRGDRSRGAVGQGSDPNVVLCTVGTIHLVELHPGEKTRIDGEVTSAVAQDLRDGRIAVGTAELLSVPGNHRTIVESGLTNALSAIEEVMYFNDPENFVLEETPRAWERRRRSGAGKGRVQRSHERPLYTVLRPTEIRRRMRLPEPAAGGDARRPHERRAHVRRYPDDAARWPRAHGRAVVVRGCWVGPSESEVGGKRYRVLVDMRPPQAPPEVEGKEVDDAS